MRVTFDTNTLDPITLPDRAGLRRPECTTIHHSLKSKRLEGFFCETLVTVEGGARDQRAAVLGSTSVRIARETIHPPRNLGIVESKMAFSVEQRERPTPHQEAVARASRALDLGMRILSAPRIGGVRIDDPNGILYVKDADEAALSIRLERYESVGTAIEARGLGFGKVLRVAELLARRASVSESWYVSLKRASDPTEIKKVASAVAEWADGDSVAAHYAYGADFFCT
jgi:hypothetical protein